MLKNKINTQNAFNVPMINIQQLQAYQLNNDEGWKKISSAIEVQSKIYGFRVDSLHNESYQMLGGLSRQNENYQNLQQENPQENKQHKLYVNQDGHNTLEKNIDRINLTNLELGF